MIVWLVQLELNIEVYLIASVLSQVLDCRMQKKYCHIMSIRAPLEANVNILRKSWYFREANSSPLIITKNLRIYMKRN